MSEARRPGRPPLDANDPSVSVSVRLPSKQFDRVCVEAYQERLTVSELLRRKLRGPAADQFRPQK